MSEHHDHDHPHAVLPDAAEQLTYYQAMEIAVRELLIEKGILTADEVRRQIEDMDGRNAGLGAKMVARAWVDPEYKLRTLTDGNAAAEEVGLDHGAYKLVVVENTPAAHNVIVCTLCSCYPRWLLGLPPDWYRAAATGLVSCASRVPFCASSASSCPTVLPCACTIPTPTCATVLPLRPAGTKGGARIDWRRWPRAIR
jgi:nitrile hydratase